MRVKYNCNGDTRNISIIVETDNPTPTEIYDNIKSLMESILSYITINPNHQSYSGDVNSFKGLIQMSQNNLGNIGNLSVTIYFNKMTFNMEKVIRLSKIVKSCLLPVHDLNGNISSLEFIFRSCNVNNLVIDTNNKVSFILCNGVNIFIKSTTGNMTVKDSNIEVVSDFVFSKHVYMHKKDSLYVLCKNETDWSKNSINYVTSKSSQLGIMNNDIIILSNVNTNSDLLCSVIDYNITVLNSQLLSYCLGLNLCSIYDVTDNSIIINNNPEIYNKEILIYSVPNDSIYLDCTDILSKSIINYYNMNYPYKLSNITNEVYNALNDYYI